MSTYLIGDVHGCLDELLALLAQVDFDPQHDTLWLTGDLVARGPASLDVLRYVRSLGSAVRMVLGNHDLHLLAVYAGISRNKPKDRITPLLEAPDADELINWLRRQPVLQVDDKLKLIMAHAGITPQWDIETAQMCAREVESVLSSDSYPLFLDAMYGDMPNNWSPELTGLARLRFSTNALTRMRFCFPNGQLDMICKDTPENAPAPLKPWFELPRLVSPEYSIIFGHWASLEGKGVPEGIYGLDTGCCWGGNLTLLRWEDKRYFTQPAFKVEAEITNADEIASAAKDPSSYL
ncbi:TPA: bis(5'-nucleosyl)-tetraphosphatase (symmetrical) ApaH [Yersinia enterocolitica]